MYSVRTYILHFKAVDTDQTVWDGKSGPFNASSDSLTANSYTP